MSNASNQLKTRPTGLNMAQRYTVRVVLLAGSLVAALIGAQAMAVIDKSVVTPTAANPTAPAIVATVTINGSTVKTAVKTPFTVTPVKK